MNERRNAPNDIEFPPPRRINPDTERRERSRHTRRANELEAELAHLYKVMPYSDYLDTAHWHWMRSIAVELYGRACSFCGTEQRTQVHHRTYERKGSERLGDLAVFCDECHARLHEKAA